MTCEELLKTLNDYVDGDVDPSICTAFEEHLEACSPCHVVVDNIRQSIRLIREDCQECELPLPFRERLHETLRDRWQQSRGEAEAK